MTELERLSALLAKKCFMADADDEVFTFERGMALLHELGKPAYAGRSSALMAQVKKFPATERVSLLAKGA